MSPLLDETHDTIQLLKNLNSGNKFATIKKAQCNALVIKIRNWSEPLTAGDQNQLCEAVNAFELWDDDERDKLYAAVTSHSAASSSSSPRAGIYKKQRIINYWQYVPQSKAVDCARKDIPLEQKLSDTAELLVNLECFTPAEKETYGPALSYVLDRSGLTDQLDADQKLKKLTLLKEYVAMFRGKPIVNNESYKYIHLYLSRTCSANVVDYNNLYIHNRLLHHITPSMTSRQVRLRANCGEDRNLSPLTTRSSRYIVPESLL